MTTPTSRRRDVRASTATAPAADEERGAELSPALAKKRENGCRLLLLRYTGRVGNPVRATSAALSPSRAYLRHEANSLPQPHAVTTLAISSLLSSASVVSFPPVPPSPFPLAVSPSPSLVLHRRHHYPTTGFLATDTPLGPLTLRRAPSRARYQPAAIPTATTESRDRPRVVGSPPVSHPTRRHATPRRAQRVFLCIAFQKLASVRSLVARPSYRKSSARCNLARLRKRATL